MYILQIPHNYINCYKSTVHIPKTNTHAPQSGLKFLPVIYSLTPITNIIIICNNKENNFQIIQSNT